MTYITEEEEQQLDKGKQLTLNRGNTSFKYIVTIYIVMVKLIFMKVAMIVNKSLPLLFLII